MRPFHFAIAASIVVVGAVSIVQARAATRATVNIAAVMHERHEGMETIGKAFKALHRELKSASPSLPIVRASAATIADLSRKASVWFPAGSGPERGNTGARPEIWQTPQDFSAKLASFQKAAPGFAAITRGNDIGAMKVAYADLGGTCKACHDKYRKEMHH